jgi:ATP-dependent Lon protease
MDRLEIVPIAGYTEFEKIQIAKKYLIPEQIAQTGFPFDKVEIAWPDKDSDKILSKLISGYTREAGVRGLKRELYRFLSAWNRRYLKIDENKRPNELLITDELLEELLGLARDHEQTNIVEVGEAIGLAWTEVGGEIMYIHAELTPHIRTEKDISQTGNLSKVFLEANHNALTVAKNLLRNNEQAIDKLRANLLCLSVPDLAIEKDGPSAGITMATAIYSELTDKLCKPYLAMTGELTIKGRVRAIGGVKEKILAAQRAGIKEVILPATNKRNIEKDIPEEIKSELTFYFVNHIKEVIDLAF